MLSNVMKLEIVLVKIVYLFWEAKLHGHYCILSIFCLTISNIKNDTIRDPKWHDATLDL